MELDEKKEQEQAERGGKGGCECPGAGSLHWPCHSKPPQQPPAPPAIDCTQTGGWAGGCGASRDNTGTGRGDTVEVRPGTPGTAGTLTRTASAQYDTPYPGTLAVPDHLDLPCFPCRQGGQLTNGSGRGPVSSQLAGLLTVRLNLHWHPLDPLGAIVNQHTHTHTTD